jgi:predicted lipoprotein with Yx(FWY)xxD motif
VSASASSLLLSLRRVAAARSADSPVKWPKAPEANRRPGHLRRVGVIVSFSAAITLTACGASSASKTSVAPASATSPLSANVRTTPNRTAGASAPAARAAQTPRGGIQISVRSSRYGRILRNGRDQTIYLFTRDPGTPSTCYGACATAWPPVLTRGAPTAGPGLISRSLGTTHRRDGMLQVTYAGHPLYYYRSDGPGQILCQNVEEFGGTWLVVSPRGTAIH